MSGGSYYGKYDCFYVRVDGSIDVNLTPKREGTIHDVQWDVYGRRFVMVYGPQPASATAYNLKANAIAEVSKKLFVLWYGHCWTVVWHGIAKLCLFQSERPFADFGRFWFVEGKHRSLGPQECQESGHC